MMKSPGRIGPAGKGEIFAWCWYDFANSAFVTVVITVVGGVFFTRTICGGASWAEFVWGLALSVSAVGAMIAGPFLGRWADRMASKKPALLGVTLVCIAGTALLGWGKWSVEWAVAIVIMANSAFLLGENLVASFLPELAEAGQRGRVSAYGWAFGYLGGLISLGLALLLLRQGGESATQQVFLMTAVFIFVASLPTALFLRERAVPQVLVPVEPDWKTILRTVQANPNLITLLLGLTLALDRKSTRLNSSHLA